MGVKKHISETPLSKSNSVDLYRPPALRNNISNNNNNSSSEEAAAANEAITTSSAAGTATTASTTPTSKGSPNREQQADFSAAAAAAAAAAATRRERRPDRAVYVPRARRSQTTPPTTTTATTVTAAAPAAAATITAAESSPVADTNSSKADDANGQLFSSKTKKTKSHRERRERAKKSTALSASITTDNATVLVIAGTENDTQSIEDNRPAKPADCDKEIMSGAQRTKPGHGNKSASNGKTQPLRIEDVASARTTNSEEAAKCDNDVRELQRASKEINRSNRRIMKQTFNSDVLEIPEKIETPAPKAIQSPRPSATSKPPAESTTEDDDEEDEDDWENMFDESGDCLDPKILQELSESVGKCKIELPKMDYTVFHIKQQLLNEEEFPHVLEVSNFPVEFKTPDLLMLFAQYKGSGFDIKWVDDTHALAVFSSSRIAAEVLTMGHPFVKLKPLAEATLESRLKAKKAGAVSLQPYRQRPETCTALARRLVSGALGVKLPTAPQERENERRVLREAKERKLLAAKQRDEVWES
ncbi:R3H and coiled-coil domain-containing protein 1 isoform X2 [Drosophila eugracilis]|uniref:R3H and coiled-coil domain-containing protein 1 isoform X2 n=1 Tax=Drosophila eugracilis TaxID=29029 RepID=UPI0007E67D97|nr:R3H and coiled-coil domain-containing protein 1 isoform X2 [Drosophila eugracilis]